MPSTTTKTRIALRAQMPVTERWAYFDHAAVAPLPEVTRGAIREWLEQAGEQGRTAWRTWAENVEATRSSAARLLGAQSDEIALVPSTTAGISLVAEGIDWQPGDNVVTLEGEFPSNVYPWLNLADRGVEVRPVSTDRGRFDLDRLSETCDERTRVVTLSWVGYASGYRQNLEAIGQIAHAYDALFCVDAIQGLGAFPLDVSQAAIDCLAADGHKWMLGPEGAGLFYVRHELLDRLRPLGIGWHSVVRDYDFDRIELELKPSAARYEGGTQNMVGMLGLGASLSLLLSHGIENVAACVLEITDYACERLKDFGAEIVSHRDGAHRSGIVAFRVPGQNPIYVRKVCEERHVIINCRDGCLRISPHAYNDDSDVDRLITALASCGK